MSLEMNVRKAKLITDRRLSATAILCSLVIFFLYGCESMMRSAKENESARNTGLIGTQWRLVSITTPKGTLELGEADGTATVLFSGEADKQFDNANSMSGDTGCNTFEGAYRVGAGHSLETVYISATEIFCGDRAYEIEQAYLTTLQSVSSYEITADTLQLFSTDPTSTLTYRKN